MPKAHFTGQAVDSRQKIETRRTLKIMERRGYRIDRRSGIDRRKVYDLNYFTDGGVERREFKERRSELERRKNWIRVDEWISVFVGDPVRRGHGGIF